MPGFILNLSCPDRIGIVFSVSRFLVGADCNILDSAQYGDPESNRFFMRVHFAGGTEVTLDALNAGFAAIGDEFGMRWRIYDESIKARVLILVSRQDHCLRELLYRYGAGSLDMEIAGVVSNRPDCASLVASYGLPFHHLPVTAETKPAQERQLSDLIAAEDVELVVLARYMQVLSEDLCRQLEGRCINIHHSFLPSFKGARPYHRAYAHGVKLIGATAHYVTAELDEGPIIEQDVARVDHTATPAALVERGQDIERVVLARAVRAHLQRRVLINGRKTVVFP